MVLSKWKLITSHHSCPQTFPRHPQQLKTSKSLPGSQYGMTATTRNFISCYSQLYSSCCSHDDFLASSSMHQGDLDSTCFQVFSDLGSPSGLPCFPYFWLQHDLQHSPLPSLTLTYSTYSTYIADILLTLFVLYKSLSTRSLVPERNESLSFLFTDVSRIFTAVALKNFH